MKRILITGAASGLGLAMAKKYASEGWAVCIADIQDTEGLKIAAQLKDQYGRDCFYQSLDITSEDQWQALVNTLSERWSGLDALINNAGVASGGPIDTLALKDFQWTVDINLMGAVKGCYFCVPLLKESKGTLINVASMAGLTHMGRMSAYNVSKAGVVALSETLSIELAPFGINVSVVCPASFPSNLLKTIRSSGEGGVNVARKMMARSPVTADDIASKVYDDANKGKYIIIPHFRESILWRIKRYLPWFYFIFMKKLVHKIVNP
jgi:NAD(P)-dependent dehydrogenase (short-subunit alcohol dehydrogenase family)